MCVDQRILHHTPWRIHITVFVCTGWFYPSSSKFKILRGQPQRDWGKILGKLCTCKEMEGVTYVHRASQLGPSKDSGDQDGKLGTTIQALPESGRRTHILYFTCMYRVSVTCLKTCHFTACFTSLWTSISISILVLYLTLLRICLYLLIFITLSTHFQTCIYRHTHTCTHVWLARRRNVKNLAQESGWNLKERK